jgi:hypothetical protein
MIAFEMEGNTMGKRGAGVALLAISAFLFAVRVLAAAISDKILFDDQGNTNFSAYLDVVGHTLLTWSIIALCGGIAYIVWAEISERRVKSTVKQQPNE